jgi:predicted urease superfamily metal-dependent hydrolase
MLQRDFDFVLGLKGDFFAQREIQLLLARIERNGTAGWESWWQVEFARFLQQRQHRHEWTRKHHPEGGRTPVNKKKPLADFIIKPHDRANAKSILLELKQSDSVEGCITNMAEDLRMMELMTATSASLNHKSLCVVGAHPRECKNAVRKTVESVAAEYGIKLFDVQTRYILNTGYAFTVF